MRSLVDEVRDYSLNGGAIAACASLPMHLLPIFFFTLAEESVVQTNLTTLWASIFFSAQLLAGFTLPLIGANLKRIGFVGLGVIWLAAALLMTWMQDSSLLDATWFCVGFFSGTAHYVSTMIAASSKNSRKAFSVRLSLPLISSGTLLLMFGGVTSTGLTYQFSMVTMLCVIAGIYILSLSTIPTMTTVAKPMIDQKGASISWSMATALLVGCALFFSTQIWFLSNILKFSATGGVNAGGAVLSIGVARVLTGLCLFQIAGKLKVKFTTVSLFASPTLAAAVIVSYGLGNYSIFMLFIGILLLELSLNILSSQFMAFLVDAGGVRVAKWLTASVLGGAAFGLIAMETVEKLGGLWACIMLVLVGAFVPVFLGKVIDRP